jgi:uncharacterized membrane protein
VREPRVTRISLGVVLLATVATLAVGYVIKHPCVGGDWADNRQYRRLCYSDIVPLYTTERLDQGKVPYLEARNEYPVLTGMAMWLASLPADRVNTFFWTNAVILGALALTTAGLLWRMVGGRALYFALAPTLLIYGFINWDLVAVAIATAATAAYLSGRTRRSGVWLGLGAAAKLYPGLLAVPFALGERGARRAKQALFLVVAAVAAWAVVNVPFAAANPGRWSTFFRLNAKRPADWDTAWFLLGRHGIRLSLAFVNTASIVAFLAVALMLWVIKVRREPGFARWTFGFPLIVAFLLTNKVYSPQYGLWLLPWFALALPNLRLFAAFEAAEIAVFVTRFRFFDEMPVHGIGGPWFRGFEVSLIVRGVILILCLAVWVLRSSQGTVQEGHSAARPAEITA